MAGARGGRRAPQREWVEEVFIDYSHAGPGPHPTTESDRYQLTQGGIRWFEGVTVTYRITGTQPITGANAAIEAAMATVDAFVTTRNFQRNDASP